jgi:hypothetical protein
LFLKQLVDQNFVDQLVSTSSGYLSEKSLALKGVRILSNTIFLAAALPVLGFRQDVVRIPERPPVDDCLQAGGIELSASQAKARLRHMTPISPPALYRSMRIGRTVLIFRFGADSNGKVTCLRSISGSPMLIGSAIESIKEWKFQPSKVHGQRRAIYGTLIVGFSQSKHGFSTSVVRAAPRTGS